MGKAIAGERIALSVLGIKSSRGWLLAREPDGNRGPKVGVCDFCVGYCAALLDPFGLAPIRMFLGRGRAAERKPSWNN